MPIYDKPTRELMHEFAAQELKPGQAFSRKDAVRWFAERYPDIKGNTVGLHVDGMSVNSPQRRHHPGIRPDRGWDLFFKLGPSEFRLWDPGSDPAPRYKADLDAGIGQGGAEETSEEDGVGSRKFAFERDLQNYLVQNLGLLEPGLKLYEDEDGEFTGVEFPAGRRRRRLRGDRDQGFARLRPGGGPGSSLHGLGQGEPRRRRPGQGRHRRQRDFRGPHPGNVLRREHPACRIRNLLLPQAGFLALTRHADRSLRRP